MNILGTHTSLLRKTTSTFIGASILLSLSCSDADADEKYVRIFDGASGRIIYQSLTTSFTMIETPIVADVDGNGTANIVIAANSCMASATTFRLKRF